MPDSRAELLLQLADDELIIGWRDSEWTGIAPMLEEDVAFSSIAQNEIGHARAVYELLSDDPDALAFDRRPEEYRSAPLVELRLLDWARTIARRYLYEKLDAIRIDDLKQSEDPQIVGLAGKIDREEAYHRMHAQMWAERLRDEPRFRQAVIGLLPYALGALDNMNQPALLSDIADVFPDVEWVQPVERGTHDESWPALWEEMTVVRRSAPVGARW